MFARSQDMRTIFLHHFPIRNWVRDAWLRNRLVLPRICELQINLRLGSFVDRGLGWFSTGFIALTRQSFRHKNCHSHFESTAHIFQGVTL